MKKICLTISIMLMIILNLFVVSNAASAELQTNISSEEIEQGKEVIVSVRIENIDGVNRGFNALTGVLEYDDNIFEVVQSKDFSMQNNWDSIIYNPANKMFATAKGEGVKTGETIFELTLKAKADVSTGEYTIKVKEFTVSEGIEDIPLGEKDVTVKVIKSQVQGDSNNTQNGNDDNVENNSEGNTSAEANLTLEQEVNRGGVVATSAEVAPNNGIWIIVVVCVAVVAIAVVAYIIKKKREKN